MIVRVLFSFIAFVSFVFASPSNFAQAKKELIKIYESLGILEDFYCKAPFKINRSGKNIRLEVIPSSLYSPRKEYTNRGKINERARRIEWEHIMPAQNFGKHLVCWKKGGRKACKDDPLFQRMEADMRNIVPAIGEINGDRSNFRYMEAPRGLQYSQYGNCKVYTDFNNKRFYPANYSKGWIARVYLYMSKTYNIKLSDQERKLMEAWDKAYPMSEYEKEVIESIGDI